MADDLTKKGAADAQRINVNEGHELVYWTKALAVTPEALKFAVKEAGPMASDVRKFLQAAR